MTTITAKPVSLPPAYDEITIALPDDMVLNETRITILDGLGRQVQVLQGVGSPRTTLDISALRAGMYFVRIDSPAGSSTSTIKVR